MELAVIALLTGLLASCVYRVFELEGEVRFWLNENKTANERLLSAWKDGAVIPSRDQVEKPEEDDFEMPKRLTALIDHWEPGSQTRHILETKFEEMLREGFSEQAVTAMYNEGAFWTEPEGLGV